MSVDFPKIEVLFDKSRLFVYNISNFKIKGEEGGQFMEKSYIFEYLDENDFRKRERSVRKYNMLAYKKLTFEYYPKMRSGCFLGEKVAEDKKAKTESYELKLPTDSLFAKVHGEIKVHYTVYLEKKVILLTNITPEGILDEGHRAELSTYKGVMISKSHSERDVFKICLKSIY